MRPETKELIRSKTHRWLDGEQTHAVDPEGCWIHARDLRSIIDCETELLKKTIEKLKAKSEPLQQPEESKEAQRNHHHSQYHCTLFIFYDCLKCFSFP
jgi:hypothetical protein